MKELIRQAFSDASNSLESFKREENYRIISEIAEILANCFKRKGKVLICGNGGSNCDAIHFAEEFTGRFRKDRVPLPVISLSDSSHITCVANDYGFEEVFSRGVEAYGVEGDVLIAISTSGNSRNIVKAVRKANEMGVTTIGLLGKDGGLINGLCNQQLVVNASTTDRIQEIHMTILHIIIEMTERNLFPDLYE